MIIPATPQSSAVAALMAQLATLEAALIKAASGQVARIREGEKWIEYHAGNVAELRILIGQTKDHLAVLGVNLPGRRGRAKRPVYF